MNKNKKLLISALSLTIMMSFPIKASAETDYCNSNAISHLKRCLLLNEQDRYVECNNYNYWNYDLNSDNKVNVFDACRMKSEMIRKEEQPQTTTETTTQQTTVTTPQQTTVTTPQITTSVSPSYVLKPINFSAGSVSVDQSETNKGIVSLSVSDNSGFISFEANLEVYDMYGNLTQIKADRIVSPDSSATWTAARNSNLIQYLRNDQQNTPMQKGVFGKVKLSFPQDVQPGEYTIKLTNLSAAYLSDDGKSTNIDSSLLGSTEGKLYIYGKETTTPEPTTTVTTTTTPEPTTTVTTTTTPEPTTTVTTTTTPEPTTTVTTTTTPEPTTTVTTTTTTPEPTTTVTTTTTPQPTIAVNADIDEMEYQVIEQINNLRKQYGMREFTNDNILCNCSDIRAKELTVSYSLNRPDGSSYNDLLMNSNAPGWYNSYQFCTRGVSSVSGLISQMTGFFNNNPGDGLVDASLTHVGVGHYGGYWVVFFTA